MTADYGMCVRWLLRKCVFFFLASVRFIQSRDVTMVIGEVGGAVTLPCTSDLSPIYLYVQRPDPVEYINGYHQTKVLPSPDPKYANRTHVDPTQGTMKLWSIRPSDEGLYECHIRYPTKDNREIIQLNVTANYSIPNVTVACDSSSCLVTCSSDNGYPRRDVEWSPNPPLNQSHWRAVNSSDRRDPVSTLFSVFSSISVSCSSGPWLNLSCAVGGALSQEHTVCMPQAGSPDILVVCVISAVSAVLLCFLVLVFISKKRKAKPARGNQGGEVAANSENVQLT
ncbi:ICOS ligand-like isoform X1 [Coregonus clupeaformis]|uniref:ICOS ligand-like isoform X1 n=1 Tax=Coregonus clupeaformis TaxID=59861 RepID=UPI001BDFC98E|nr:ICOS ligand-like isoform X1 [Coregonus clupeaformis]